MALLLEELLCHLPEHERASCLRLPKPSQDELRAWISERKSKAGAEVPTCVGLRDLTAINEGHMDYLCHPAVLLSRDLDRHWRTRRIARAPEGPAEIDLGRTYKNLRRTTEFGTG